MDDRFHVEMLLKTDYKDGKMLVLRARGDSQPRYMTGTPGQWAKWATRFTDAGALGSAAMIFAAIDEANEFSSGRAKSVDSVTRSKTRREFTLALSPAEEDFLMGEQQSFNNCEHCDRFTSNKAKYVPGHDHLCVSFINPRPEREIVVNGLIYRLVTDEEPEQD